MEKNLIFKYSSYTNKKEVQFFFEKIIFIIFKYSNKIQGLSHIQIVRNTISYANIHHIQPNRGLFFWFGKKISYSNIHHIQTNRGPIFLVWEKISYSNIGHIQTKKRSNFFLKKITFIIFKYSNRIQGLSHIQIVRNIISYSNIHHIQPNRGPIFLVQKKSHIQIFIIYKQTEVQFFWFGKKSHIQIFIIYKQKRGPIFFWKKSYSSYSNIQTK